MRSIVSNVIFQALRPCRMIIKRWGPVWLKRLAWRSEFKRGEFMHNVSAGWRSRICDDIERYANGGDILDLGCSDGHVSLGLDPKKYSTYTGVDISDIGIAEARVKCRRLGGPERLSRNSYMVGDISTFVPDRPMDVILFKDSLYYVNRLELVGVLRRLQSALKPQGVLIVEMDNIKRHSWIRDTIRKHFSIIADQEYRDKDFMLFVFR